MANSEFEYVRKHEQWDALAPDNWIVVRIDGRGFSKFSKRYDFQKPNDRRAVDLMNAAAVEVVKQFTDIVIAYGQSDEFSFVFHEDTTLFDRRAQKVSTTIAATFSVEYAMQWPLFFPDSPLTRPYPTFDGRCVVYPKTRILRDYLSWRQADCHINNLYNTTFWSMVLKGEMSGTEAELALKGTVSSDKNEILFSRFGINYNKEPEIWKKGNVIYRDLSGDESLSSTTTTTTTPEVTQPPPNDEDDEKEYAKVQQQHLSLKQKKIQVPAQDRLKAKSKTQREKDKKNRQKARVVVEHVDIIKDGFWEMRPWILGAR
ncbi:hypothetical protein AAFC00_003038 [Neodothiora populina]|uniref:tRNA(His) guanylyltransferase n=1 Tax=Neodothiora populina TaxID=2781224 RepID=A0ABR3P9G8_9PEZI